MLPRQRRTWLYAVVGLALIGLGVGGVFGYLAYRERTIQQEVARALDRLLPDQPAGYLEAEQALTAARSRSTRHPKVAAALALVHAHLTARFSQDRAGRLQEASSRSPAPSRSPRPRRG